MFTESRITAILAPGPGNPRNSEGSFITLDDGRIAFAYSRYIGDSAQDHAACAIAVIYSTDGGEHWSESPELLVAHDAYGARNVMSVSLCPLEGDNFGLFYLCKYPGLTSEYRMRRYWKDFSHCTDEVVVLPGHRPGYYVVNNDRVVRLSDGRLMVPAALHPSAVCAPSGALSTWADGRGSVCFIASKNDGRNWVTLRPILTLADPNSNTGLQEPGLLELPGGALYAYFRTDRMWQYESVSLDGGQRWFAPQPSTFSSPPSPMLIRRSPHDGRYYAVWNPTPNYTTRSAPPVWTGGRDPLVLAVSDDGVHFGEPVVIESDPTRGFCYPAMHFPDESTLLLAYCSGGQEDGGCLNRLTIRRLTLA